jgi:hypothetical protein
MQGKQQTPLDIADHLTGFLGLLTALIIVLVNSYILYTGLLVVDAIFMR